MEKNYFSRSNVFVISSFIVRSQTRKGVKASFESFFHRCFLFLLTLALALPAAAQVTIGTSTTTQIYPLGNVLGYERSAAVYLASEVGSGTITKLAWYATSSVGARPLVIYLKKTSANTLSTSTWDNQTFGATTVFSGMVTPVQGWNTITLNTSFDYDSSDGNLLVLVEANAGGSGLGATSNAGVRHSPANFRHMFFRGNNAPPSTNGVVNGARPNIQITMASAAVAPNCANYIFPSVSATGVSRNATIIWAAAEGTPESYDVYFGTSSNPPLVNNVASTSYSPALLAANTQYFWKVIPKNSNGSAVNCAVSSFTTSNEVIYCNSTPISNDNLGITNIVLGQSSFSHQDVTYSNFTTPVQISRTSTANLQVTFATGVTYNTNVWIDYNNDGEFSNTELVSQGNSQVNSPTTLNASFYIPESVALGQYKMRIGTADIGQATPNPCYSGSYGVTVDMMLDVIEALPLAPECPTVFSPANGVSNVILNPTLTWSEATGNPTSYDVYFGTSPNPTFRQNVSAAITSYTPNAPLDPSQIYYWKIVAKNSFGVASNCSVQVFMSGEQLQYCTPTYSNSCATSDIIHSFSINTLSNLASGCNSNANNYINYPATGNKTTALGKGMLYSATIKNGANSSNVAVFIDFNRNGSFENNERFGASTLLAANASNVISIAIPTSIEAGLYRMRVRSISGYTFAQVDPCSSGSYGETEDYTVSIIECNAAIWYADQDNDGYGNNDVSTTSCDQPQGYVLVGGDCDDTNAAIYRSASLYIDQDGDGYNAGTTTVCYGQNIPQGYSTTTLGIDCDDTKVLYVDADGDGFGSAQTAGCGVLNSTDCDDNDSTVFQNQYVYIDADQDGYHSDSTTICMGSDLPQGYSLTTLGEDCDDSQITYVDTDGDGYGSNEIASCGVSNNSDCDDLNADVYQSQILYVDFDNDSYHNGSTLICYGDTIPEGYSLISFGPDCNDNQLLYADADGDGYGAGSPTACGVSNNTDCDDNNAQVHQSQTVFIDTDGDGFDAGTTVICFGNSVPLGYSLTTFGTDCDDTKILYADMDGDGYGAGNPTACGVEDNTDCDDANVSIYRSQMLYIDQDNDGFHGGTATICFGANVPQGYILATLGEDCDDSQLLYSDEDGDGYGAGEPVACGVSNNTDCNDSDVASHESQLLFVDSDHDGYHGGTLMLCVGENIPSGYSLTTLGADCDDQNSAVYKNEYVFIDNDGDGYDNGSVSICFGDTFPIGYSLTTLGTDCNDSDASVYYGAILFADADGDGYHSGEAYFCYGNIIPSGYIVTSLGIDCDDNNYAMNAGVTEILYNGIDENCNGQLDEGYELTTMVKENQCGIVLSNIYTSVQVYTVVNATSYRFKITNVGTNEVEFAVRSAPWFQFTSLQNYSYDATYSVEVELEINGIWLGYYGSACTLSTPSITGVSAPTIRKCGETLERLNTVIITNVLPGVSGYRFRVTNVSQPGTLYGVQILDRDQSYFNLTMLESFNYSQAYSVEVAVKMGSSYSAYGEACTIYTPSFNTSLLEVKQCGSTYTNRYASVNAISVPYATAYKFRVTNITTNQVQVLLPANPWFQLSSLQYFSLGTSFSVEVAVKIAGEFTQYGAPCIITTPAAKAPDNLVFSNDFKVSGTPNPFSDVFTLNITTSADAILQINVYDMLGKLIETRNVDAKTDFIQLGERYPSGVYSVLVTQHDQVKVVKMIKR